MVTFSQMLDTQDWNWGQSEFSSGETTIFTVQLAVNEMLIEYGLACARPRFVVLQTSKTLLGNFKRQADVAGSSLLSRDDTYKTNFQGLPIEIPSTSDLHHHCHVGGVAIKSHEDCNAALGTQLMLMVGMHLMLEGYCFRPTLFVADHSWAFLKANRKLREVRSVAGVDGTCYSHLTMAIRKTGKKKLQNKELHGEFRSDVEILHQIKHADSPSGENGKSIADMAEKLFIEKWRDDKGEEALAAWFSTHWLGDDWGTWGAGQLGVGFPHSNAGPEGINNALKHEGLDRNRSPLGIYFGHMSVWLKNRGRNERPFPTSPHIPVIDWIKAQKLTEDDEPQLRLTLKKKVVGGVLYDAAMPSRICLEQLEDGPSSSEQVRKNQVKEAFAQFLLQRDDAEEVEEGTGFDEYCDITRSFHLLKKLDTPLGEYILYSCTCKLYLAYQRCKHVLAFGICQGLIKVPPERSLANVGRKPKAGRPSKAVHALERQPCERTARRGLTSVGASSHDNPCCMSCGGFESSSGNPIMFCDGGCDLGYHLGCTRYDTEPRSFCCADCEAFRFAENRRKNFERKRKANERMSAGAGPSRKSRRTSQ